LNSFYLDKSDEFYFGDFWKGERDALKSENAFLLPRDEANKLNIEEFFKKSSGDIKPRLNKEFDYFAIPYELDDEVMFEGSRLADSIVKLINENLGEEVYFASTDNDKCCVIKMNKFSEAIFWNAASGHLNTPFIVFDKSKLFFVLLDYDLPIQMVGFKKGLLSSDVIQKWKTFFQQEWSEVQQKYKSYTALSSIVTNYYQFAIK